MESLSFSPKVEYGLGNECGRCLTGRGHVGNSGQIYTGNEFSTPNVY